MSDYHKKFLSICISEDDSEIEDSVQMLFFQLPESYTHVDEEFDQLHERNDLPSC